MSLDLSIKVNKIISESNSFFLAHLSFQLESDIAMKSDKFPHFGLFLSASFDPKSGEEVAKKRPRGRGSQEAEIM